jgi:hypothetical protein
MTTHKRTKHEFVLSDNHRINWANVYIVDGVFTRCKDIVFSVGEWKRKFGHREIRRCDWFTHPDAKLGDRVEE